MNRRDFVIASSAALFGAMMGVPGSRIGFAKASEIVQRLKDNPLGLELPDPLPEITAAVDTLVPADPDIPGDFKGSDYNGDRVVAYVLGDMGQASAVGFLNKYAKETASKDFIDCNDDERLGTLQAIVLARTELEGDMKDLLTGLLTISMIGTFELNNTEEQATLFESMGWYDPDDPAGTFRVPNEGYVDAQIFPVTLKKGLLK